MSDVDESIPRDMPVELARELARQGEVRLSAILSIATAADQRATTLAGVFGAGAVGMATAALAVLVSDHAVKSLVLGGALTALGFLVATMQAAASAGPVPFYLAGGDPAGLRNWSWTGDDWRSEAQMLEASAMRYSDSIKANTALLESNAAKLRGAFRTALASPLLGAILVFLLYSSPYAR